MMRTIDLNSDLGESFGQWKMGDDASMLGIVSSANIACGFHAGDPAGILKTVEAAARNHVVIGAHVAYPDLVGFGRRNMDMASDELTASVIYQIGALQGLAKAVGTQVRYVKPHGALYNTIAHNERQGMAVIKAILAIDPTLKLVCLANSPLITLAKQQGVSTVAEAFADRAYTTEVTLVSRQLPNSVLHDQTMVAERMLKFVQTGMMTTIEGTEIQLAADSICVHGDSPGAVDMAKAIKARFTQAGINITSFI